MSFSVSSARASWQATQTHCPSCGAIIRESYVLIPCGHPSCEVRGCGDCLTRCEGDQFRCEDHFMSQRLNAGLVFYTFSDFQEMLDADEFLIHAATDPALWAVPSAASIIEQAPEQSETRNA